MVRRDVARRAAESVLTDAFAGRGRLLLVAGEAGIGKTTLVRSVAEEAEARGGFVRWGACWDGASLLPFAPWIDALRRQGADDCSAVAVRLANGGFDEAPDAAAAARARARLFADVVDALRQAAADQPQVVVLEDLHWADAPTLELARALAPYLPTMAVVVVATYRDDELSGDELAAIGGSAELVELSGLSEQDVASLLAGVLGRDASADEARTIHRQTGGNPLFVTQVGRLVAAGAPMTVPAGAREVLVRRLARLTPPATG